MQGEHPTTRRSRELSTLVLAANPELRRCNAVRLESILYQAASTSKARGFVKHDAALIAWVCQNAEGIAADLIELQERRNAR